MIDERYIERASKRAKHVCDLNIVCTRFGVAARMIVDKNNARRIMLHCAPEDCRGWRSEEHTSELQSLMRISYAVFCLKKKNTTSTNNYIYSQYYIILNLILDNNSIIF